MPIPVMDIIWVEGVIPVMDIIWDEGVIPVMDIIWVEGVIFDGQEESHTVLS